MYIEADGRQVDFMISKMSLRGRTLTIRAAAHPRGGPECLRGGFPQDFPSRNLVIFMSRSSPRQGIRAISTVVVVVVAVVVVVGGGGGRSGSRGITAIEPAP